MSRHRNVRNLEYDDFGDDDDYYDDYDEYMDNDDLDQYCISPGTMQQYTYNKNNHPHPDITVSTTQEPPQHESDNFPQQEQQQPPKHVSDEVIKHCVDQIRDVVGDNFTDEEIFDASRKFEGDHQKSINHLLDCNQPKPKQQQQLRSPQSPTRRSSEYQVKVSHLNQFAGRRKSETVAVTRQMQKMKTPSKAAANATSSQKIDELTTNDHPVSMMLSDVELTPSRPGKKKIDYMSEFTKRHEHDKKDLSLVVIGHVDAGKSTLMGNLLFQTGIVSKQQIHRFEQESKKVGKSSFAYAWVLDETEEERNRGITMDIACNSFETKTQNIMLMDAPGHRDFIPNMITGAAQADVALLVVGASTGEFESGFGAGGQTREHALLVRTLGVNQLAVAINKLDTMDWSQKRYNEIVKKLKPFLKQAGYRDSDVTFVPVSGLHGDNLVEKSTNEKLTCWYSGPSLIEVIDKFEPPKRSVEFPLRFTVNDIFKNQMGQTSGISLFGKIESGGLVPNTKVIVMPSREKGLVKKIEVKGVNEEIAICGQHATIQVNGIKNHNEIYIGSIVCALSSPIPAATVIRGRVVVFDLSIPIYRGSRVELHYKSMSTPASICKLRNLLDKTSGEIIQKKPRFLTKGNTATIEVKTSRVICVEEYEKLKEMGRFTLRYSGATIAAGIITKIIE